MNLKQKYKVGDRVRVTGFFAESSPYIREGDMGTITDVGTKRVRFTLDKYRGSQKKWLRESVTYSPTLSFIVIS